MYISFVVNEERDVPGNRKRIGAEPYRPPQTISRRDYLRHGRDEWFREVIYTTVQALGRLIACREAFGRALDLTATQFAVLMGTAYRQDGHGVSIGELARHISLAPSHVTTEVGRLIRAGYLVKRPNPEDGRSVLVSLSGRGEAAIARVAPLVRRVNDLLFDGIAAGELDSAATVMRRIVLNSEFAMAEIRTRETTGEPPPKSARRA
jgi:DNA-binding MarR family transcriptional regulator